MYVIDKEEISKIKQAALNASQEDWRRRPLDKHVYCVEINSQGMTAIPIADFYSEADAQYVKLAKPVAMIAIIEKLENSRSDVIGEIANKFYTTNRLMSRGEILAIIEGIK